MSDRSKPRIAIIGAGIGGVALAAFLQRQNVNVQVYEQAEAFARVGAGIQTSPNAMRVLRALGVEAQVRARAFQPPNWANRDWDTGAMRFDLELGAAAEERYGAPYLLMHRGDLHEALLSAVDPALIQMGRKLVGLSQSDDGATLQFADGDSVQADIVVGADGVHSRVRELSFGPQAPNLSGRVAYRTTFSRALLNGAELDESSTKWWGPDRHIVIYPVNPARDEIYFVTSVPEPDWIRESWSARGDVDQLRAAFVGFHPQVQAVLAACPSVHKWAILERDPMAAWSAGRVVLLGDACHPMTPYMAQGAASAMEDATVLARCLASFADPAQAFASYFQTRQPRTAEMQLTSHRNEFMRGRTDASWVYGYDPVNVELIS
jgi:6-hydroxynicotinate 3-monooxygenase